MSGTGPGRGSPQGEGKEAPATGSLREQGPPTKSENKREQKRKHALTRGGWKGIGSGVAGWRASLGA